MGHEELATGHSAKLAADEHHVVDVLERAAYVDDEACGGQSRQEILGSASQSSRTPGAAGEI
jgi:hypothetical protein